MYINVFNVFNIYISNSGGSNVYLKDFSVFLKIYIQCVLIWSIELSSGDKFSGR